MTGDECLASWRSICDDALAVSEMTDPRNRNRAITARYARLYLGSTTLKWPGIAAFASKQVGCAMQQANWPLLSWMARSPLASGNREVFKDIYPALRFTTETSANEFLNCFDHLTENRPDHRLLTAFQLIRDGDARQAALEILRHEQHVVLPEAAFNRNRFRWPLFALRKWKKFWQRFSSQPLALSSVVFLADCRTAEAAMQVSFRVGDGEMYDPDARMAFATRVLDGFLSLEITKPEHIADQLSLLAGASVA